MQRRPPRSVIRQIHSAHDDQRDLNKVASRCLLLHPETSTVKIFWGGNRVHETREDTNMFSPQDRGVQQCVERERQREREDVTGDVSAGCMNLLHRTRGHTMCV